MKKINPWFFPLIASLILILPACGPGSGSSQPALPTNTPTPTPPPLVEVTQPPAQAGPCAGLEPELGVQLVLPYAAEVDLDPTAAGAVPLEVDPETHQVQGQGHISYDQTQTWTDEDGTETAEVFLELDLKVEGECVEQAGSAELQLKLDAVHQEEQGTTTCADPPGECRNSPVMGPLEQSFDLTFPLEDGYTVEKEDWTTWTFVIHLAGQ